MHVWCYVGEVDDCCGYVENGSQVVHVRFVR